MRALPLVLLAALLACEDPNALPDASVENAVDSLVSLWAVSGTPVERHSGYAIRLNGAGTVRTERLGTTFDVVFDIDTAGRALLLPRGALDLGSPSGVLLSGEAFDSLKIAPTSGYQDTVAVELVPGAVAVIRSQVVNCGFNFISFPLYAKLEVLAVDLVDRRMDFKILANINCGYSSLERGLPRR